MSQTTSSSALSWRPLPVLACAFLTVAGCATSHPVPMSATLLDGRTSPIDPRRIYRLESYDDNPYNPTDPSHWFSEMPIVVLDLPRPTDVLFELSAAPSEARIGLCVDTGEPVRDRCHMGRLSTWHLPAGESEVWLGAWDRGQVVTGVSLRALDVTPRRLTVPDGPNPVRFEALPVSTPQAHPRGAWSLVSRPFAIVELPRAVRRLRLKVSGAAESLQVVDALGRTSEGGARPFEGWVEIDDVPPGPLTVRATWNVYDWGRPLEAAVSLAIEDLDRPASGSPWKVPLVALTADEAMVLLPSAFGDPSWGQHGDKVVRVNEADAVVEVARWTEVTLRLGGASAVAWLEGPFDRDGVSPRHEPTTTAIVHAGRDEVVKLAPGCWRARLGQVTGPAVLALEPAGVEVAADLAVGRPEAGLALAARDLRRWYPFARGRDEERTAWIAFFAKVPEVLRAYIDRPLGGGEARAWVTPAPSVLEYPVADEPVLLLEVDPHQSMVLTADGVSWSLATGLLREAPRGAPVMPAAARNVAIGRIDLALARLPPKSPLRARVAAVIAQRQRVERCADRVAARHTRHVVVGGATTTSIAIEDEDAIVREAASCGGAALERAEAELREALARDERARLTAWMRAQTR